jgi:hypothetical protein
MRLKYLSPKAIITADLRNKLTVRFGPGRLSAKTSEQKLKVSSRAASIDIDVAPGILVRDGLEVLGCRERLATEFSYGIFALDTIRPVAVKNLVLPTEQRAQIRQSVGIRPARVRMFNPVISVPGIRQPGCGSISPPAIRTKDTNLSARRGNRILISHVLALPHVRSSIDIDSLPDSEYEGFLREAEILKGLPVGRCELQAVFRNIPVELISQIRFLEEQKTIVYSISESRRTRTRVHDMAAVRDTNNQEIHLVPHRTRFRWASLDR